MRRSAQITLPDGVQVVDVQRIFFPGIHITRMQSRRGFFGEVVLCPSIFLHACESVARRRDKTGTNLPALCRRRPARRVLGRRAGWIFLSVAAFLVWAFVGGAMAGELLEVAL